MVFTSLGMIYFFIRWLFKPQWQFGFLAFLLAVVSFLLKPFTLFLLIPLFYLGSRKWRLKKSKWLVFFFWIFVSLLPFFGWRWWMSRFPEGVPGYSWLFNEDNIRFKGAFFRWVFAERVGKLILGYWGLIPFGVGMMIEPKKKEKLFFWSWLAAIFIYFIIVAGGNVRHDYYQVLAIPIICLFLAKGTNFLLTPSQKGISRLFALGLGMASVLFMLAFSWYEVRGFFNVNHPEIVEAGKRADGILPPEAKVIAPYNGDTAFLYHINRQGWPIPGPVPSLIEKGATHYVSVNFDVQTLDLMENYEVLEKTDRFVILDLRER